MSLAGFVRQRRELCGTWCVGNEAGDTDSIACAIAYAYLTDAYTPVVHTKREDLALRPENLRVLQHCGLSTDDLVCVDDVHVKADDHVVLVDHNLAHDPFSTAVIDAIVDHHVDEQAHASAQRIVLRPDEAGSCASVTTQLFSNRIRAGIPRELADLLLSAVLLDTLDLDAVAGKVQAVDRAACTLLAPQSSFATRDAQTAWYTALRAAQADVSQLTAAQKLRRDYKQFALGSASDKPWVLGASSTTEPLAELVREAFWNDAAQFVAARGIDLLAVLAGYDDTNGSHRELLLYAPQSAPQMHQLATALGATRENSVDLVPLSLAVAPPSQETFLVSWTQQDVRTTRKQFVPVLRAVCGATPHP